MTTSILLDFEIDRYTIIATVLVFVLIVFGANAIQSLLRGPNPPFRLLESLQGNTLFLPRGPLLNIQCLE